MTAKLSEKDRLLGGLRALRRCAERDYRGETDSMDEAFEDMEAVEITGIIEYALDCVRYMDPADVDRVREIQRDYARRCREAREAGKPKPRKP